MSLRTIDEYVRQLEAIKFYPQVKRQNKEGFVRIKELESQLEDAKNQIKELEELRVSSDGRTLGETQKLVLKAKEEEVERRADAKLGAMKDGWEKEEKWKVVRGETNSTLIEILKRLSGSASVYPAGLEESGIPKLVKETMDEEVKRRTDATLNVEWPNFLRSRVTEMEARIQANIVQFLAGHWEVPCNSCGMVNGWTFDPNQISDLSRGKDVLLQCANPECRGPYGLPYRFRVKLSELIAWSLGQNQ